MATISSPQTKLTNVADFGFSKPTSFVSVIVTTVIRDIRITKRYKANLIGGFLQVLVFLLIFSLFASAVTFRGMNLTSSEIYTFYLSGLTLIFFGEAVLYSTVETVNKELYNGTLEFIYSSPSSRYAYFLGGIMASFLINLIFYIPLFVVLVTYSGIALVNIGFIVSITAIFLIVLAPMGVMIAMSAIMWKQVGQITAILSIVMNFFSGIFFPVQSLPQVAQYIAYLLPFTFALDLVRYYSFNGDWDMLFPKEIEFAVLLIYGVIYTLITKWLLGKVERHAKTKGLHLI